MCMQDERVSVYLSASPSGYLVVCEARVSVCELEYRIDVSSSGTWLQHCFLSA